MLRRRRVCQFRRNTCQTNPNRRRVMKKRIHNKVLRRKLLFVWLKTAESSAAQP